MSQVQLTWLYFMPQGKLITSMQYFSVNLEFPVLFHCFTSSPSLLVSNPYPILCTTKPAPRIFRGSTEHLASCEGETLRALGTKGHNELAKFFTGSLGLEALHRVFPLNWAEIACLEMFLLVSCLLAALCANWSTIPQKKAVEVGLGIIC